MANNVIQNNKCFKNLEAAAASFLAAFNLSVDPTDTLEDVFDTLADGISMYTVAGNDTSVYPVAVPISTSSSHKAIVLAIKEGGMACFVFIYGGEAYICETYTSRGGFVTDSWYLVSTQVVT